MKITWPKLLFIAGFIVLLLYPELPIVVYILLLPTKIEEHKSTEAEQKQDAAISACRARFIAAEKTHTIAFTGFDNSICTINSDAEPDTFGNALDRSSTAVWFTPHVSEERITSLESDTRVLVLYRVLINEGTYKPTPYYKIKLKNGTTGFVSAFGIVLDDGVRIPRHTQIAHMG